MTASKLRARVAIGALLTVALVAAFAVPGNASGTLRRSAMLNKSSLRELASNSAAKKSGAGAGSESRNEILEGAAQYAEPRYLPAGSVSAEAVLAARTQAAALPLVGPTYHEVTTRPYDSDDPNYRDPVISNSGGGAGLVTGRMSALAVDGGYLYAGAADGGVWRSTDGGQHWTPLTDGLPTTSTGALAVSSDHAVWLSTGEANTAFENYLGMGVFHSADHGTTWTHVGGTELDNQMIAMIVVNRGRVLAATSAGVYRRSLSAPLSAPWTLVLRPGTPGPYGFTYTWDVDVRPGTSGHTVVSALGWRGGPTDYNGFFESNGSGAAGTWHMVHPNGIRENDIGRSTLAYSGDGSTLYAVVESLKAYATSPETALKGIFVSPSGDVAGPWKRVATFKSLSASGSALGLGQGYAPGIQAWYNQFLAVDPHDSKHVYAGLEEVFETRDGGQTWSAIGPYWNFGLPCSVNGLDSCPKTTHPDQHAVAIAGNRVFVGNDGGVYSKPLDDSAGWSDLNATLRTLQYYYAGSGHVTGGTAYWGGLQDNGGSLLLPGASTMVSPFGGDGGDTIVDPHNGLRTVQEYVYLDMFLTTNAGASDGSTYAWREISPSCFAFTFTPNPCDPNPRFIAPFRVDQADPQKTWVSGGEFVWVTNRGWSTTCSASACDWKIVHDTGAGNTTTALAMNDGTIYAGWCGGGCNPDGFSSGIDTNYGGTWHTVAGPTVTNGGDPLPQRYIFNMVVDSSDSAHVYALYSAYSRRWIPGGGLGHVFESKDAGKTWNDISGNLPDAPADDVVIVNGHLVLSTDVGIFSTSESTPGTWTRYGSGLPNAIPGDLSVTPSGDILVATHGRGLWKVAPPS
jgi:hypothetical protein